MATRKTYKVDKHLELLFSLALSCYVPVLSIHELLSTGTIDLQAVTPTRRALPMWLMYLGAWLVFAIISRIGILPAIAALKRGYLFEVCGSSLRIKGTWIERSEISSFVWRLWSGDLVLKTSKGNFTVNPRLNHDGKAAISHFLRDIRQET